MLAWAKVAGLRVLIGLAVLVPLFTIPAAAGPAAIEFKDPCAPGDRLRIAAVGDLLFHKQLQVQAYRKGGDFRKFWAALAPVLAGADLTYGNLEGPAAYGVAVGGREAKDPGRVLDGRVYSADLPTLNFNYNPLVIDDIKASGFDLVSTANNHAFDRNALGIDRTIEALDAKGLPFTGTRKRNEVTRPWSVVTEAKGFKIAWVACTFSLNGFKDRFGQVLFCFEEKEAVLAEIRQLSQREDIDAVILTPHWGVEGSHVPDAQQKLLAKEAIENGATVVIGTHPHVLQPWEKIIAADGREALIVYSTGNFISNQRQPDQRSGEVVILDLVREKGKKARVASARFIPTWVVIDGAGHRVVEMAGKSVAAQLSATFRLLPAANRVQAADALLPVMCPAVN